MGVELFRNVALECPQRRPLDSKDTCAVFVTTGTFASLLYFNIDSTSTTSFFVPEVTACWYWLEIGLACREGGVVCIACCER